MKGVWKFLSDAENQKTLGWLGASAIAIVGAFATYTRFVEPKPETAPRSGIPSATSSAVLAPAEPAKPKPATSAETGGIVIGGNVSGSNISTSSK